MAMRRAMMMIMEIDTPTFPLITFIILWKELKIKLSSACWKNCKKVLALVNEIQANFLLITKRFDIQEMLDCVVYSSFNVHMIR